MSQRHASRGPGGLSKFTAVRLQKELVEWQTDAPQGCWLNPTDNLRSWQIGMVGAEGTLYADEIFTVRFDFPDAYPMESPVVVFVDKPPVHPHIYSNGHICLNILYDGWSPAMTVSTVCISLLSMLSSCTDKTRPDGDREYVQRVRGRSPKETGWLFHDDAV